MRSGQPGNELKNIFPEIKIIIVGNIQIAMHINAPYPYVWQNSSSPFYIGQYCDEGSKTTIQFILWWC